MSRLRVRNAANTKWLDICQSEWYVRNPSNTGWERFTPKQGIKARHGAETYWLDIDCIAEGVEDCEADEYGGTKDGTGTNGSGKPNGDTSGTPQPGDGSGGNGGGTGGNGSGPNGPTSTNYGNGDLGSGNGGTGWVPGGPYPDGYDLPDSDGDGAGWNGSCYFRPGLNVCEPKIPLIVRDDMNCGTYVPGSYNCPFVCPDSIVGIGAGISEFYLDLGKVSGKISLPWSANPGASSFDVYYRGKIVASTYGKRSGTGILQFVYVPVDNDSIVFVRVRSTASNTRWTLQLKCVNDNDTDGDISDPRPCHGTYEPKNGGQGVYEFYHNLGPTAGIADIHYQMWNQPDRMDVYDNRGKLLQTTGGYVAGEGHLKINHVPGGDNNIRVRITARDPGTSWVYLMTCPGEKGSEDDPRPCSEAGAVKSGGAGVTDTYVDFGATSGKVGVRYQMYEIPDKLDVYQNGTLVATTGGPVTGDHWLYFGYDPAKGRKCNIRVTGSGKTSWSFLHTCPGEEDAKIDVDSPSVLEGNAGESNQLCWTITQQPPTSLPVTVDYSTGGGTANPLIAKGRILAIDEFNNPFIAVVDGPNVGRAAFDGGFPKFYNSGFVTPAPTPTGQVVFDTWMRSAGAEFYSNPSQIPAGSEALAWQQSGGKISATTNSNHMISFISPGSYTSYTFEATLSSAEADDDMIGMLAAFARVGSDNYSIVASRQRRGLDIYGAGDFTLTLLRNDTVVSVLGVYDTGGKGNWLGAKTRVQINRDCNKLTVKCSPWGSVVFDEATKLTIDLTGAGLEMFLPKSYYGLSAQSQANASFSDIYSSGIGLAPAFTYLKNLIQWTARTSNVTKKVLLMCDTAAPGNYALDAQATGFATGIPLTITAAGFTPEVKDVYAWNSVGIIPISDLQQYDTIIFIGSRVTATGVAGEGIFKPASVTNIGQYVKNGGGLIVITDHYVFQSAANQLANQFGIEFYDSVDRNPVSIADMITRNGDHQAWDGLHCERLPAGPSEGAIRMTEKRPDYVPTSGTVTFAPGETSKTVCVPLVGNDTVDGDRTVVMTISNASKGTIRTAQGTGTIQDDDNALCRQRPTGPVYERPGAADGAYLLHVQPNYNCAAGGTKYLMQAFIDFPASGPYVFNNTNDDDFELYVDCKLVASGPIGNKVTTVNVNRGKRNVILRYLNVPNCTPGYAGFSIRFNNQLVYVTRAADWKGQANSIGEIESSGYTPPVVLPPVVLPPTCNSTPEICQVYRELFNRLPDEAGAQYWLSLIITNNWQVTTPAGYAAFKAEVRRQAGQTDCVYMGGTWDAANNRCII